MMPSRVKFKERSTNMASHCTMRNAESASATTAPRPATSRAALPSPAVTPLHSWSRVNAALSVLVKHKLFCWLPSHACANAVKVLLFKFACSENEH